jgi:hypothetical protein
VHGSIKIEQLEQCITGQSKASSFKFKQKNVPCIALNNIFCYITETTALILQTALIINSLKLIVGGLGNTIPEIAAEFLRAVSHSLLII